MSDRIPALSRRSFVTASALAAGAAAVGVFPASALGRTRPRADRLRVGLVGCGGRGKGAATDILKASPDVEIVALGDVLAERVSGARETFSGLSDGMSERVRLSDASCFVGWDAFKRVIDSDIDVAILATPPGFRPGQFAYAVEKGRHVFMEKPVAVDPVGVRKVIAAAKVAKDKNLSVVCGTQRRHEQCYLEAMKRIKDGAIGTVTVAQCYWMQGGLWMNERKPEWSDMEWQLRNWLYFTWLSGDHICEQHVHNIDVVNWVLGTPKKVQTAIGGRQVRTDAAYGHVFDHFGIVYEYDNGVIVTSMCQQIDGCQSRCEEVFQGTEGTLSTSIGRAAITGKNAWKWKGDERNPYEQEHVDLVKSIRNSEGLNEGVRIAESTLTAIMGRMSAYTGKTLTWEQAMESDLDLTPAKLDWGSIATPEVAVPGRKA
ncbi:Glycosyl hydrolase family 109 protein 1 [Phycisphaerales bacterium]|nr:Glycosyl hydrolase family 109 protein 1 [Phycisphaerales bacterium]